MLSVSTTLSTWCARCRRWPSCTPRRALCSRSRNCARAFRTTLSHERQCTSYFGARQRHCGALQYPQSRECGACYLAPRPMPPGSEVSSVRRTPALRPWPSVSRVSPARREPAFLVLRRLGAPVPVGCAVRIIHCESRRAHADSRCSASSWEALLRPRPGHCHCRQDQGGCHHQPDLRHIGQGLSGYRERGRGHYWRHLDALSAFVIVRDVISMYAGGICTTAIRAKPHLKRGMTAVDDCDKTGFSLRFANWGAIGADALVYTLNPRLVRPSRPLTR
jgi:hypothetical protein